MDKLVYRINEKGCKDFFKRYPKVYELMRKAKGRTLRSAYSNFLKLKDDNQPTLGGRAETISSPSFGTKTFYHYEWGACSGWAELFEYYKTK